MGIFLVLVSFIIFGKLVSPMKYMDNEYPYWINQKDYIRTAGAGREILFLGDSAFQAAILPQAIAPNAYVLALGGATPLEMHYTLTEYLKHHEKPESIYLAFIPIHYADMESYRTRNLYFHYFPWREVVSSQWNICRRDDLPLQRCLGDIAEDMEYVLRLPTKYFRTMYDSGMKREAFNLAEYHKIREARGHKHFGLSADWHKSYQPYPGWLQPFRPLGSLDFYLREIIRICQEQEIALHVLQNPMHEFDYRLTKESGYYDAFLAYMERLREETGASVMMEIPVYEVEYFGDNLHVNEAGAKRYTEYVRQRYFSCSSMAQVRVS